MAGIECRCFNRAVSNGRSQFSKGRKPLNDAAGRIDYNTDSVVRTPNKKAAILSGPHPRKQQVLPPRFGMPEIGVIRQVDQDVRAFSGELPDKIRKGGFVTDKNAHLASGGRENL